MKKCYNLSFINCCFFGLLTTLITLLNLDVQAQNGPAIQWNKIYGGFLEDHLQSLQQTFDGGYLIGGTSSSGIGGNKTVSAKGLEDYWILKLDNAGNKVWEKAFGGTNNDKLNSLQQTSDGGYILGGSSASGSTGDKSQTSFGFTDFWVIKLDGNGDKIWDKTFGGSGTEILRSVQQTADGGYILGGISDSGVSGSKSQPSKGMYDYWLIKIDVNGNKQWDKTFGGNSLDNLYIVRQTTDGGYLLGGGSNSDVSNDKSQPSKGGLDYWIIKLDTNGNKQWDRIFGGSLHEVLYALQQTSDGGYILGGFSFSPISGDKTEAPYGSSDFWIVKLDAGGIKQWDKLYGGGDSDIAYYLQESSDGSYLIGGTSSSVIGGSKTQPSRGQNDYWLIKTDATGNKIWDKTLGSFNEDRLTACQITSDGGYILGGWSESNAGWDKSQNSNGRADFWIVKLAPDVLGINETEAGLNFSLSPNPSQGKFNLQLSGLTAPTAEITVTDLLGRKVLQQQFKTVNAQLSEEIKLPTAAKGMYLLQVKAGQQTISRKIVVE